MKPVRLKSWDKLPREEQDLYLRILWNDDYSEKAIADFLKATKGQIVRRRQLELKIPTGKRGKVKSSVVAERFFDLLDIHKMDDMVEKGVTPIAPVERMIEDTPAPEPSAGARKVIPMLPPRAVKAPVVNEEPTCQWPVATGKSLKRPKLCGEPTVPGKSVCEEHDRQIRSLKNW